MDPPTNPYQHFKAAIESYPARTLSLLGKHGSKEFRNSSYLIKCHALFFSNIFSTSLKYIGGSACLIFGATFLLHRKRSWVLTSPGGLRSFMFKYLPFSLLFGLSKVYHSKKVSTDLLNEDFGDIEE